MSHLGVVVGRFQVPDLHPAHHVLIGHAMRNSDQLLILAGVAKTRGTNNDPLDFPTRRLMLQHHYPDANVVPIEDVASDRDWSRKVDTVIRSLTREEDKVTLFTGRAGIKNTYKGVFPVQEIESIPQYSGTALRIGARKAPLDSVDFRVGVVYGVGTKYAQTHTTVDIAVIRDGMVLMATRPGSSKVRFPGGFVGFTDKSLEHACHRELMEEIGLEARSLNAFEYVASLPVDDWRYRGRPDQRIMTTLFVIKESETVGDIAPDGNELEEFTWVASDGTSMDRVTDEHKPLLMALSRHIAGNPTGVSEGPKATKKNKVTA